MTGWNSKDKKTVLSLLKQIKKGAIKRKLPADIYEQYVQTFKKVATEVGIVDKKGRVLLTKRPEKSTHPAEPFPGMWHIPGVTHHPTETSEKAIERLIKDELENCVDVQDLNSLGYIEANLNPRGLILSHIYIGRRLLHVPSQGEFFFIDDLPENTVDYHKEILIPRLINSIRDTS